MPREGDKWSKWKIVKIFGSSDDYTRALDKLALAEETSNVEDSDLHSENLAAARKRRQQRKKKVYSSSDDDSNAEQFETKKKKYEFPMEEIIKKPPQIDSLVRSNKPKITSFEITSPSTSKVVHEYENVFEIPQQEDNSLLIQERRKRKDIHLCSRHQRRIIQPKTQHEYYVEYNFHHSIQKQLNIKVDTNSNNESSTFESNETAGNDFDEMFNKSNTSCNDFEQCEVSNEILNGDNYESPPNFSDKPDDESIDNDENDIIDTLKADLSQWALKYAIHHNAINDLLLIISKYIPSCSLPQDARTLLHTPRETLSIWLKDNMYMLDSCQLFIQ